jgi:hypothetical protein
VGEAAYDGTRQTRARRLSGAAGLSVTLWRNSRDGLRGDWARVSFSALEIRKKAPPCERGWS